MIDSRGYSSRQNHRTNTTMTRLALHPRDDVLDATRKLILERGIQSATVDAIASESGAPIGSLYHRFRSRNALLAELWIRAVVRSQSAFLAALQQIDPTQAAVDAALSIFDFVRQHPDDARLLAAFRREDLLPRAHSAGVVRRLKGLNRPLEGGVRDLAHRLFCKTTSTTIAQTMLAVVDMPMGAIRRYLLAGKEPPFWMRAQIEAMVKTALQTAREQA